MSKAIHYAFPSAQFIIPLPISRSTLLKRRLRLHGFWKALGQVSFRALHNNMSARRTDRIDAIWRTAEADRADVPEAQILRVANLNAVETLQILRTIRPKVVFVFGVGKISADTLQTIRAPFINLHPGITPKYRGVHTGYWALLNGDTDQFGFTVHTIDTGLDTGPVITQTVCTPNSLDDVCTYNSALAVSALPQVIDILRSVIDGAPIQTTAQAAPAPIFHEPTIWTYALGRLMRGVR